MLVCIHSSSQKPGAIDHSALPMRSLGSRSSPPALSERWAVRTIVKPSTAAPLSASTITDHGALELRVEQELTHEVDSTRAALGLRSGPGCWSADLAYLLSPV